MDSREVEPPDSNRCKSDESKGLKDTHLLEFSDGLNGLLDDSELVLVFIRMSIRCPLYGIVILPTANNIGCSCNIQYTPYDFKLHGIVKVLTMVPENDQYKIAYSNLSLLYNWPEPLVSLHILSGAIGSALFLRQLGDQFQSVLR